jgi:NTP pyrophosphatase (non-canonical NTP hydrolase)
MTTQNERPRADAIPGTSASTPTPTEVSIADFQQLIRRMYYDKDVARGVPGTFMWLMEEIGELSSALRETSCHADPISMSGNSDDAQQLRERRANLQAEFADVLAWLTTLANVVDVDLNQAVRNKYGSGCPGCSQFVCQCPDSEKP